MTIFFRKPTHFTNNQAWINLSVDKVKLAKKKKEQIIVILPQGECRPVDPATLLKYGKRTEAVYLYPDRPMKLVGYYFTPKSEDDKLKEFSENYLR